MSAWLGWLNRSVSVIVPAPSSTVTSSIDALGTVSSSVMLICAHGDAVSVAPAGVAQRHPEALRPVRNPSSFRIGIVIVFEVCPEVNVSVPELAV